MSDYVFETSSGEQIPIVITTRRGLRNITLRPRTAPRREIHISKPWLTPTMTALRFVERKRAWIERIFDRAPQKAAVHDGVVIEFLGRRVTVRHDPARRGNAWGDAGDTLWIGGAPDMFQHRLRDVIQAEFLSAVRDMIRTTPRDLWPRRIALRDTSSRWGSCSSTGTISFSWRLALAPWDVMRYVVMHELAHRRYMDHSPEFWAFVRELYGPGVERAKRWLHMHGGELHRYF
ncbi:M48 family metallopeptidase [bacterium]|nr:M48 family metallopeptidase [bacterium]